MIYILVALLLNNHILIDYNRTNITNVKEILEIKKTNDIMDVDKIVKKYMLIYGINYVRGGSYKNDILEDWQIKSLKNELNHYNQLSKLDNFANDSFIDNTISEIIYFRNHILKLKEMDIQTNFNFNINNIIEAITKYEHLNKLKNQFNSERGNRRLGNPVRNKLIKLEEEIIKLNNDINKLLGEGYEEDQINYIINEINSKYSNYQRYNNNIHFDNDIIIKLYSVKIFNIQIKEKLKNFKSPYGSTEEEILEKYKELLKRKLFLIS